MTAPREAMAAALLASTTFGEHSELCPVWKDRMVELDGGRVDPDDCECWVKRDAPGLAGRYLAALAASGWVLRRGGPGEAQCDHLHCDKPSDHP